VSDARIAASRAAVSAFENQHRSNGALRPHATRVCCAAPREASPDAAPAAVLAEFKAGKLERQGTTMRCEGRLALLATAAASRAEAARAHACALQPRSAQGRHPHRAGTRCECAALCCLTAAPELLRRAQSDDDLTHFMWRERTSSDAEVVRCLACAALCAAVLTGHVVCRTSLFSLPKAS
jgi:hypothetical protein